MEKRIIEFRRAKEEEECSTLEVMAVSLNDEDHKNTREELKGLGFRFDVIESDMIRATLSDCDPDLPLTADELLILAEKLESTGWVW